MESDSSTRGGKTIRDYCSHSKPAFDTHRWCAPCRASGKCRVLSDPCLRGEPCEICTGFSADQRKMLGLSSEPKGRGTVSSLFSFPLLKFVVFLVRRVFTHTAMFLAFYGVFYSC